MRNNLRAEWEGWRRWLFGKHREIETVHVRKGHLLLEHDGTLIDLGPCTLEDLKLIAFVAQEAYIRLPSKRGRSKTTPTALARVRNITNQFWTRSENPSNRSSLIVGRSPVEPLTGDGFPRD